MPDEHGRETDEEARERVERVRGSQIFGDTPTDPTIGDVVAPAHDEEAGNAAAAEVASRVEDGDEEAGELSPEEAKRQHEPLDAADVDANAEDHSDDEGGDLFKGETDQGDPDADDAQGEGLGVAGDIQNGEDVTAAEKIKRIESASSAEEVNALAEGDERVTVQRAADKKRSSWG